LSTLLLRAADITSSPKIIIRKNEKGIHIGAKTHHQLMLVNPSIFINPSIRVNVIIIKENGFIFIAYLIAVVVLPNVLGGIGFTMFSS